MFKKNADSSTVVSEASATSADSNSQNDEIITSTPSIKKKEEESEVTINSSEDQTEAVSLSEYLSKMFCTLCHKRCLLSNPRCGKSKSLIEEAKAEYQELYGETN